LRRCVIGETADFAIGQKEEPQLSNVRLTTISTGHSREQRISDDYRGQFGNGHHFMLDSEQLVTVRFDQAEALKR